MTAINVIRQAAAVHILSDGIFCTPEGIIAEVGPNAFTLPHLPAALAIRGTPQFMPFLVHRLGRECQSFDELLRRIVPVALEVHMTIPMILGYGDVQPSFDLVVAGWSSARGRCESYFVGKREEAAQYGAQRAWELVELPDVLIAPAVGMEQIKAVRWSIPESAEAFRPETDGVKLLTAQRLSKGLLRRQETKRDIDSVGGFVQLTTISSKAVRSSILHRWADQAGQRIGSD